MKNDIVCLVLIFSINCSTIYKLISQDCGYSTAEISNAYFDGIEEEIPKVLWAEVRGFNDSPEFLKAHAIIVRTWMLKNIENGESPFAGAGYASDPTTYNDYTPDLYNKFLTAAYTTAGKVIAINNELIKSYFFSRCNGQRTRALSEAIFVECGGCVSCTLDNISYLPSVVCNLHSGCSDENSDCCTNFSVYGHGVGMCQFGGYEYGKQGKDHKWIIDHYYPGTCITNGYAPIPSFICRGCVVDLELMCNTVNAFQVGSNLKIQNMVIKNNGSADAIPTVINFHLSPTPVADNVTFLGSQNIGSILGDESITVPPISFDINNFPNQIYYLIVVVDPVNTTSDVDLTNSICTGIGPIQLTGSPTCSDNIQNQGELETDCGGPCPACSTQPNLTSRACATPLVNGNELTILYEISNTGSQWSGSFVLDFYAYRFGNGTPHNLGLVTSHSSLPGNSSQVFSKTVNLDNVMSGAGLTAGDYKLGMVLDEYFQVNEADENDNFCVTDNYFTYSTTNLKSGPGCVDVSLVSESINVSFEIVNEGNAQVPLVNYQVYVYHPTTNVAYPLGPYYGVLDIPSNGSVQLYTSYHLETEMSAHGLSAGEYGIGIEVDVTENIEESNENDNTCVSAFNFTYSGSCTMENGFVQGAFNGPWEFSAPNYIISPDVGNQTIFTSNSNVTMSAGDYIDLNPGFVAQLGSVFTALIDDCANINDFLRDENIELTILLQEEKSKSVAETRGENWDNSIQIENLNLMEISPNPFSSVSLITIESTNSKEPVSLELFDLSGKKVKTILNKSILNKGQHQVEFFSEDLISGTFILRLQIGEYNESQKLIFSKY